MISKADLILDAIEESLKSNLKTIEYLREPEQSRGECDHKNKYMISGNDWRCDDCGNPQPKQPVEEWEKQIRDENWDTEQGIMTKQEYLRHGKKIGTGTTQLKVEMIINYIKENFIPIKSEQQIRVDERAKVIGRLQMEIDIAKQDVEMADDPNDPKVRLNYFENILSSLKEGRVI